MKIAISGPMGSGKSTIANMIKSDNDKYIIYSFGGKIKEIAYDLFDMNKNIKDRSLLINIADNMRMIDQDIWAKYIVKQIIYVDSFIIYCLCSNKFTIYYC